MRRMQACLSSVCLWALGCASIPPVENPLLVRPHLNQGTPDEPQLVVPGQPTPEGYALVYDRVLDAVDDSFDVIPSSRYAGIIETEPRIAAGYEQPWKYGSPDPYERWLATFQTIRHKAIVRVFPGETGGFRVSVEVYKELEDLNNPIGAIRGGASFRELSTVDRRVDTTGPYVPTNRQWIPIGRDPGYEQKLLRKIQDKVCR